MASTATFQEVPAQQGAAKPRQKLANEFSDDEEEDLEEEAAIEANERINSEDEVKAEYTALRSHIATLLRHEAGSPRAESVADEVVDEEEFGDDVPMTPGGGNLFEPEEEHVFRLAHLCGDSFTGAVPVFLDGRVLLSSSGKAGPVAKARNAKQQPAVHAEMLRAFLSDAVGLDALKRSYDHVYAVHADPAASEEQRSAAEQRHVEAAREILAQQIGKGCEFLDEDAAESDDELENQETVQQHLAFLCQLVYFDEEVNRQQS